MKISALNYDRTKALQIYLNRFGVTTPVTGVPDATTLGNYRIVLKNLGLKDTDELTEAIAKFFADKALEIDIAAGVVPAPVPPPPGSKINPVYWAKSKYHPRFEHLLPAPYTHIHPYDVLRSVAGQTEIPGSKHNMLIAHFHEHSLNLGSHSDEADYADEVAHCSSAINWACDGGGCRKSNNALAASWSNYRNPRSGDWVEVGDLIHKRTGSQNHVTFANKRFNRKTDKTYEGFGSNQGNSIKTTVYSVAEIISVQVLEPLPGTVLAPIGFLGTKPVPATGGDAESTR